MCHPGQTCYSRRSQSKAQSEGLIGKAQSWPLPDNEMLFLALPALCCVTYTSYHKTVFNALSYDAEKLL